MFEYVDERNHHVMKTVLSTPPPPTILLPSCSASCSTPARTMPGFADLFEDQIEQPEPTELNIKGKLPEWLKGTLFRNGPGLFKLGEHTATTPLDGFGLLSKLEISEGTVSFSSRYIQSQAYKGGLEAGRYVFPEFSTPRSPDPKASFFSKVKNKLILHEPTDNSPHNVFYMCGKLLTTGGGKKYNVLDPNTLETLAPIGVDHCGADLLADHPCMDENGTSYILGSCVKGKPSYKVIGIPPSDSDDLKSVWERAYTIATIPGQFTINPSMQHSLVATENYLIVMETPMQLNIATILTSAIRNKTVKDALEWEEKKPLKFTVIKKEGGTVVPITYLAPAAFALHVINAHEVGEDIVLDVCEFTDIPKADVLFSPLKELKQPDYLEKKPWTLYKHHASRYILPVNANKVQETTAGGAVNAFTYGEARATKTSSNAVNVTSQNIVPSVSHFDFPQINHEYDGKKYKFFYAFGAGLSDDFKNSFGKMNVDTHEVEKWEGADTEFPSEPIFVANPSQESEDDGILLSPVFDVSEGGRDYLLVLDAKTMKEVARAEMPAGKHIPPNDHAVFVKK